MVLYVKKMPGLGWYVMDSADRHLKFKSKLTGSIISYFGTKKFAMKAIRDAFPGASVPRGRS